MDVLPLIQQQHGPQVPYPLVSELLGGNQLQALQLEEGIHYHSVYFNYEEDTIQGTHGSMQIQPGSLQYLVLTCPKCAG